MSKISWHKLLPLVGVLILCGLILGIGPAKIAGAFAGLRYEVLLILLPLLPLFLLTQTLKWRMILRCQQIHVPFTVLFRINLIGIFYGAITPGRAGMLLKVGYLAKYCAKPVSEVSSSVIIDKLIEFIVLGCFAVAGSMLVAQTMGRGVLTAAASVTVAFVVTLLVFCSKSAKRVTEALLLTRMFRNRLMGLRKHVDRFYADMPVKAELLVPFALTICCWLLIWTQTFVVATALGMCVSYRLFITVLPIASLIALIPVSINGIGTRETTLVGILTIYGVAPEKTVTMSLVSLMLCGYVPAVFGALLARCFKMPGDDGVSESESE